jgi:hypothetical protein
MPSGNMPPGPICLRRADSPASEKKKPQRREPEYGFYAFQGLWNARGKLITAAFPVAASAGSKARFR